MTPKHPKNHRPNVSAHPFEKQGDGGRKKNALAVAYAPVQKRLNLRPLKKNELDTYMCTLNWALVTSIAMHAMDGTSAQ